MSTTLQRRRSGSGEDLNSNNTASGNDGTTVLHREGAPVRKSRLRRPTAGGAGAGTTPVRQPHMLAPKRPSHTTPQSQAKLPSSFSSPTSQPTVAMILQQASPSITNNHNHNASFRNRRIKKKSRWSPLVTGCGILFSIWVLSIVLLLRHLDTTATGGGGGGGGGSSNKKQAANFWSSLRGNNNIINNKLMGWGAGTLNVVTGNNNNNNNNAVNPNSALPAASTTEMVDMRDLTATLSFDNPDGGAWKQGWDIKVPANQKNLKVFVVPHSHCDPGWLKTFDAYFRQQTSQIITTVVETLLQDRKRTFVWAEISYFSWWWTEQNETMRQKVKTLLDNGQLEFVTGGWVQPDEANSELYAMEVQLQEGHDWISQNLGSQYIPKYGWSIDPFGYSPTMAYLLKKYKFKAMLIQRVHYAVKKELAQRRHLEFYWRQTWDDTNAAGGSTPLNNTNVHEHDMFTHLMPFFSYDIPHTCGPDPSVCCQFDFHRSTCPWGKHPQQITPQNVNERALLALDQYRKKAALYRSNVVLVPLGDDFRYQTTKEALAQFTNHQKIHDYINENVPGVSIQFGTLSQYFDAVIGSFAPVPVLKGSFFTYADVNEDYWSGYFTSRAFDKALDRQLERVLYAAEAFGATTGYTTSAMKEQLQQPRRELSLFQHHDGITGTARDNVVQDYAQRMHSAIQTTQQWLLQEFQKSYPQETAVLPNIQPCWVSSAPRGLALNLCGTGSVALYNPLDTPQSCGVVVVPPKQLKVGDLPCEVPGPAPGSKTKMVFDPTTGLMQEPFKEDWKVWKVRAGGAYLFKPGELSSYDLARENAEIEDGGYVVKTEHWKRTVVEKQVPTEFGESATVIDFIFEVNLDKANEEWIVRFSGDIANGGIFHTDLNGFNFDTHKLRSDLPIQSQVFPMPTLASIEDSKSRMTVLSEHAQGTASLQDGSIDVWLDRRLAQDDARGLGQGVMDNRPLRTRLRLVLETSGYNTKSEFTITKLTRLMWSELQHPLEMFGTHTANLSPTDPENLKKAAARREEIRNGMARGATHRALNKTDPKESSVLSTAFRRIVNTGLSIFPSNTGIIKPERRLHTVDNTVVPFVYMIYKRVDYLKKAIDSLRKSDFPKSRVPLIISHDGRVPAVVEYVESLKSEFNVIQLFHPYSCYDHPDTFPGNATKLNVGYKGDHYGNPRTAWVTCCKHHFTWILKTVFEDLDFPTTHDIDATRQEGTGADTFLFMEEDYVVAPTVYAAVVEGLNVMEAFEDKTDGGFFGLGLDPTEGNVQDEPTWIEDDSWYVVAFHSGPMTMNRQIYWRLQEHATEYCRFDEYNWDWTLVHLQSLRRLPHTLLKPSRTLARHIGIGEGMHAGQHEVQGGPDFETLTTSFAGTNLHENNARVDRVVHETGYGGWGHPADQQHCIELLRV